MPIIKSRVRADEVHAVEEALAAAHRDVHALRQQVLKQRQQLDERSEHNTALAAALEQAEADLKKERCRITEMQSSAEMREKRHREQMSRMRQNASVLEEMVQASRRSEREQSSSSCRRHLSACNTTANAATQAGPSTELHSIPVRLASYEALNSEKTLELLRQPPVSPCNNIDQVPCRLLYRPSPAAIPPLPAQALYWQEQLLISSLCAVEGFSEAQQQLRRCLLSPPASTSHADGVNVALPEPRPFVGSAFLGTDAYSWGRQLHRLQALFDEVVQADAKLISCLLLETRQQSQRVHDLQERWVEAQHMVRDAETVLDEAAAQLASNAQELAVLRQECATLTEMQAELQAQLTSRTREHQAAVLALHLFQEAQARSTKEHSNPETLGTTRLTQAADVQQQYSNPIQKLEAALLDEALLMSTTAASVNSVTSAKERVASFVKQLNTSAHQLQSVPASLPSATPSPALAAPAVAAGDRRALSSVVTSPEFFSPGASPLVHSACASSCCPLFGCDNCQNRFDLTPTADFRRAGVPVGHRTGDICVTRCTS
ncbi:hypothetical protein JKF63_07345 [Porcisia hertigi]|uniref:Uncharacterized protein n=1 Tax=Porcisia hertigi TaxID=2761500 RepID=A0A836YHQ6_9TRYP|nr:hypothetical protein JKF63_07345 [Porcisia hertigi]